jgi:hypothetical protein
MFVNEPRVRKNAGVTVHVIGRTELPVSYARLTACDTVVVAAPGPAHCVAHGNVQCVRNEPQFVSHRTNSHIDNLAASQPSAVLHLMAVLVDNPHCWKSALFSC